MDGTLVKANRLRLRNCNLAPPVASTLGLALVRRARDGV